MGDFDDLHKIQIGGNDVPAEGFQFWDYTVDETPIVKTGTGRTGTSVKVSGTASVQSDSASGIAAAIVASRGSLSVSGKDIQILGIGGAEHYEILASDCIDGGPHISFSIKAGSDTATLMRDVAISIEATRSFGTFGDATTVSKYKESTETDADGLRKITRTGQTSAAGAADNATDGLRRAFASLYPGWAVTGKHEIDFSTNQVTYSFTATEFQNPLPAAPLSVDGDGRIDKSIDEQGRATTTYDFNLLVGGNDYQSVLDAIRAQAAAAGQIMRERVSVTLYKKIQLQASYEILSSATNDNILTWSEALDTTGDDDTWAVRSYVGADPILVLQPKKFKTIVQSGSATGCATWVDPAKSFYPELLIEAPKVRRNRVNDFEFETQWSYTMVIIDENYKDADQLTNLARPSQNGGTNGNG